MPYEIDCSKFVPAPGVTVDDCWVELVKGPTTKKDVFYPVTNWKLERDFSGISFVNNTTGSPVEIISEAYLDILADKNQTLTFSYNEKAKCIETYINPVSDYNFNNFQFVDAPLEKFYNINSLLEYTGFVISINPNPISQSFALTITNEFLLNSPTVSMEMVNTNSAQTFQFNNLTMCNQLTRGDIPDGTYIAKIYINGVLRANETLILQ